MILEAVPVMFRGIVELTERHEPGVTRLRRSPAAFGEPLVEPGCVYRELVFASGKHVMDKGDRIAVWISSYAATVPVQRTWCWAEEFRCEHYHGRAGS